MIGGDYTRFTFDPRKRYNAVLRQQGRVAIDADHNEAAEIDDRRRRSETYDLLSVEEGGPAGLCVVPRSTPDAFLVTPAGGSFTLGVGRAWVDGIQVENFGAHLGPEAWSPVLEELIGTAPTPYEEQPFLSSHPNHPHLPDPPGLPGEPYLAYLKLWDREVDSIVDPGIREKALGGPDHGTRVQTVWQVRALGLRGGDADARCGDELAAWDALTAPSAGRLTTVPETPEPGENPCTLSPEGGYRGRENRLYRVEIHDVAGGTATWKWSRDNASVKAAVTEIAGITVMLEDATNTPVSVPVHRLTVSSLGRDDVLRFVVGGWVEVLDEHVDLEPDRTGVLARVIEIDEARGWITLDRTLPATFDLLDPVSRITRVVRWDQTVAITDESASPEGALAVDLGVEVALEDGIRVSLDLAAPGRFRIGDYWTFAARTADSSVETLAEAPPRGPHHHYARLAMVTAEPEDCRLPWPPEGGDCCCCTRTVAPGEDVQDAVDDLPEAGGMVCLGPGDHLLQETVVIAGDRVTVRGCGRYTRVVAPAAGPAFDVRGQGTILEGFQLEAGDRGAGPLIHATGNELTVRETSLLHPRGPLLVASDVTGLECVDNRLAVGTGGGLDLSAVDAVVARNRFTGTAGALRQDDRGSLHLAPGCERVDVLDNVFEGSPGDGITLGGLEETFVGGWVFFDTRVVVGNDLVVPDDISFRRFLPIRRVRISRNRILGAAGSGITSRHIALDAVDDTTGDPATGVPLESPFGHAVAWKLPVPVEDLTVTDNLIRDCVRSGPELGPRNDEAPYGGIVLGHADRLRIAGNEITGNGASQTGANGTRPAVPVAGIFVRDVRELEVSGNLVVDNGRDGEDLARHPGPEGGVVALEVSVDLESVAGLDQPRRPDGPSAALIHGNRVESVRGLALQLGGDGPMQIHDNAFSRLRRPGDGMGGAVLVLNTGLSPLFGDLVRLAGLAGLLDADDAEAFLADDFAQGSGAVSFCNNRLRYDQRDAFDAAVALLLSFDDVDFSHNSTECRLAGGGLRLFTDALVIATTARSHGNRLSETLSAARLSLWNLGIYQSTGTGNQATHCILVEAAMGQRAEALNLALCCFDKDLTIVGSRDGEFPCRPRRPDSGFNDFSSFTVGDVGTGGL